MTLFHVLLWKMGAFYTVGKHFICSLSIQQVFLAGISFCFTSKAANRQTMAQEQEVPMNQGHSLSEVTKPVFQGPSLQLSLRLACGPEQTGLGSNPFHSQ